MSAKGVDFRIVLQQPDEADGRREHPKEELSFQVFDFPAGEVVTHDVTYPGGKKSESVTRTQPFTAITTAHYDRIVTGADVRYRSRTVRAGMMSVTDIYGAVRAIGVSNPGELLELSFFSHAWHGGPILVNSATTRSSPGPRQYPAGRTKPTLVGAGARSRRQGPALQGLPAAQHDGRAAEGVPGRVPRRRLQLELGLCVSTRRPRDPPQARAPSRLPRVGPCRRQGFRFTNFRANHIESLERRLG